MATEKAAGVGATSARDAHAFDQLAGQIKADATAHHIYNQQVIAALKQAVCGVLRARADRLRNRAAELVTITRDAWGGIVRIVAPEAAVMLRTARFFDECASDIQGGAL